MISEVLTVLLLLLYIPSKDKEREQTAVILIVNIAKPQLVVQVFKENLNASKPSN